jgi:hypothetical protein
MIGWDVAPMALYLPVVDTNLVHAESPNSNEAADQGCATPGG